MGLPNMKITKAIQGRVANILYSKLTSKVLKERYMYCCNGSYVHVCTTSIITLSMHSSRGKASCTARVAAGVPSHATMAFLQGIRCAPI